MRAVVAGDDTACRRTRRLCEVVGNTTAPRPRCDSTTGGPRRRRRRGLTFRYNVTIRQRRSYPRTKRRGWWLVGRGPGGLLRYAGVLLAMRPRRQTIITRPRPRPHARHAHRRRRTSCCASRRRRADPIRRHGLPDRPGRHHRRSAPVLRLTRQYKLPKRQAY